MITYSFGDSANEPKIHKIPGRRNTEADKFKTFCLKQGRLNVNRCCFFFFRNNWKYMNISVNQPGITMQGNNCFFNYFNRSNYF